MPVEWRSTCAGLALCLLGAFGCRSSEAKADVPAAAATAASCGVSGAPDCPLQLWMKANLQSHLRRRDFARLGTALHELAQKEPRGYGGWAESAERGAAAAARADEAGVRESCQTCHEQHRDRFRQTQRAQNLF